jgi:hypothetical protein
MFRQSVFGRLAGYEDVNDASRFSRDPVMRLIIGQKGLDSFDASESPTGWFQIGTLACQKTLLHWLILAASGLTGFSGCADIPI